MLAPIAAVINQSDSWSGKMKIMKNKTEGEGEVDDVQHHKVAIAQMIF